MNELEYFFECVQEECAEVAQRASKINRFGVEEIQPGQELTNAQRLMDEFHDLVAVLELLEAKGVLSLALDRSKLQRKKVKVFEMMGYSARCGTLQRGQNHAEAGGIGSNSSGVVVGEGLGDPERE